MCLELHDLFKFWEVRDISLMVQWNTSMKLYVAYRMAPLPMPLNDLANHFCGFKPF